MRHTSSLKSCLNLVQVDMEGKRFAWQGVVLLPFIDEHRLLTTISEAEKTLTPEESRRNSFLDEVLFVTMSNPLSPQVYVLYDKHVETEVRMVILITLGHLIMHNSCAFTIQGEERAAVVEEIESNESIAFNGFLKLCAGKEACPPTFSSPISSLPDVEDSEVLTTLYKNPEPHPHVPKLLDGVVLEPPMVTEADFEPTMRMWHEMNTLPRNETV